MLPRRDLHSRDEAWQLTNVCHNWCTTERSLILHSMCWKMLVLGCHVLGLRWHPSPTLSDEVLWGRTPKIFRRIVSRFFLVHVRCDDIDFQPGCWLYPDNVQCGWGYFFKLLLLFHSHYQLLFLLLGLTSGRDVVAHGRLSLRTLVPDHILEVRLSDEANARHDLALANPGNMPPIEMLFSVFGLTLLSMLTPHLMWLFHP